MKLIVLTGMDGTGKTTLAKLIVRHLNDGGMESVYLYGRMTPIISRFVMSMGRLLFLRGKDLQSDYPAYSREKMRLAPRPALRAIFVVSILLDASIGLIVKLLPNALRRSRIVVADRYIYDTVITDIAAHLDYSHEEVRSMLGRAFRWFPRPEITLLLDASEELAFSRKTDLPHPDYLRQRRGYYLMLADRPEVTVLDAARPQDQLMEQVDRMLRERGEFSR